MISAIIFDLNGTIIDDEPVHEVAFKQICVRHKVHLSHDDYKELCFGRSDREGWEGIAAKYKLERPDINSLITKKGEEYLSLIANHIRAVPGVTAFIKDMHGKYKLAVASGAVRKEIDLILEHLEIRKYFSAIVSTEDVSLGKPDPAIYRLATRKIKSLPVECLAIEDSIAGIISAKEAGLKCIAITTTQTRCDLANADPDLIIDSFSELDENMIKGF